MDAFSFSSLTNAWDVFLLFVIPIGGGIPAGVVLAQSKGIGWMSMLLLYFVSDILLAFLFEPLMMLFIYGSKRSKFLANLGDAIKKSTSRTISGYGSKPGPFLLVTIAFGVDPMTGRAAAMAAGHGFISGWAIAILGDMFFFGVVMASTIWLNNILGDGTWAAVIIMVAMMVIPSLVRRFRTNLNSVKEMQNGSN